MLTPFHFCFSSHFVNKNVLCRPEAVDRCTPNLDARIAFQEGSVRNVRPNAPKTSLIFLGLPVFGCREMGNKKHTVSADDTNLKQKIKRIKNNTFNYSVVGSAITPDQRRVPPQVLYAFVHSPAGVDTVAVQHLAIFLPLPRHPPRDACQPPDGRHFVQLNQTSHMVFQSMITSRVKALIWVYGIWSSWKMMFFR